VVGIVAAGCEDKGAAKVVVIVGPGFEKIVEVEIVLVGEIPCPKRLVVEVTRGASLLPPKPVAACAPSPYKGDGCTACVDWGTTPGLGGVTASNADVNDLGGVKFVAIGVIVPNVVDICIEVFGLT